MRYVSVIFLFLQLATSAYAASSAGFLSLADIHFNPFASCEISEVACPLVEELRQNPANQWREILLRYQTHLPIYKNDTNYPLLQSALNAAKYQAHSQQIHFVVILGDYLAHRFKEQYLHYSMDKTGVGYAAFVKKTLEFLTQEIATTFPSQNIYFVIGNNDSYVGNYISQPNGAFYQDTAALWSKLLKSSAAVLAMQHSFPKGGYYSVDLTAHLRLLLLNSVLFSQKAAGTAVNQAAQQELTWLHQELLQAKRKNKKVLIALHIPPVVDVYSSLGRSPYKVIGLWKPRYTERFQQELCLFSDNVIGILAGHLHMDSFQLIHCHRTLGRGRVKSSMIPITSTPAISPVFGNNPAFKIYRYSDAALENFRTYFDSLEKSTGWQEEYDFKALYQPDCSECQLVNGMDKLEIRGKAAEDYINYFAVGTNSQPITVNHAWFPFYWCQVHHITVNSYQSCLQTYQKKRNWAM